MERQPPHLLVALAGAWHPSRDRVWGSGQQEPARYRRILARDRQPQPLGLCARPARQQVQREAAWLGLGQGEGLGQG